jgi:hypothetical protein
MPNMGQQPLSGDLTPEDKAEIRNDIRRSIEEYL